MFVLWVEAGCFLGRTKAREDAASKMDLGAGAMSSVDEGSEDGVSDMFDCLTQTFVEVCRSQHADPDFKGMRSLDVALASRA